MKLGAALFAFTLLMCAASLSLMHIRKKEVEKEQKRIKFQDIKLRVTQEVLEDHQLELSKFQAVVDRTKNEAKELETEFGKLQATEKEKTAAKDTCQGEKKHLTDELASLESEASRLNGDFTKEKTSWEAEVETLKQQMGQRSKTCDFVKDSPEARKLCGDNVNKEAAKPPEAAGAKAEEAKKEEPKAEEVKKEEPKAEEAKKEEPKAEEAKKEEPKAEEAKKEEAKAEAPKRR